MASIPDVNFNKIPNKSVKFNQTEYYEGNFDKINEQIVPKINELDTKVNVDIPAQLADMTNSKVDKNGSGQVTYAMLSQDAREQITGGNTAVVGKDAVLEDNITNGAVTPKKTDFLVVGNNLFDKSKVIDEKYINFTNGNTGSSASYFATDFIPLKPNTTYYYDNIYKANFAFYDANKGFLSSFAENNLPNPFTTGANVVFGRFSIYKSNQDLNLAMISENPIVEYVPFIYKFTDKIKINIATTDVENGAIIPLKTNFFRGSKNMIDTSVAVSGYVSVTGNIASSTVYETSAFIPIKQGIDYIITPRFRILSFYDSVKAFLSEKYLGTTTENYTFKSDINGFVRVGYFVTDKTSIMMCEGTSVTEYEPYGKYTIKDEYLPKTQPSTPTGYKKSKYEGYKVVCFGDSITGGGDNTNQTNDKNYVKVIEEDTGIITHKQGYHSGRMAYNNQAIKTVFSMYKLVDAIIAKDFTEQENALVNQPDYAIQYTTLQRLKTIDFSTIDFVTIAFGTNDFGGNIVLDNPSDKYDINTYKGATRYVVKRLLEAYPHLKILLLTPIYRFKLDTDGTTIIADGGTWQDNNGNTLVNFVDALLDVGKELNIPVVDMYRDLGINEFNRLYYFANPTTGTYDGTHPHHNGTMLMGHKIAGQLISRY